METSILIVQFGDSRPTIACIKSIYKSNIDLSKTEIILVDNNLDDSQKKIFTRKFPKIKYIKSQKNNYCHALNIGTKKSKGRFVVLLNPDTIVHKNWLKELISACKKDEKIAGVTSKILFQKTKKINSLGIEQLKDFYFRDIGFEEDDDPNLRMRSIDYASGCCVLYRRKALKDVDYFDEDFVMYVEDVDMGIKLRKKGWKLLVNPKSIVYHAYHGTAGGVDLAGYFCNRNRFQLIAKHYPLEFAKQIEKSQYAKSKKLDDLYDFVKAGIIKLIKSQPESVSIKVVPKIFKKMSEIYTLPRVQNLTNEVETFLGLRKPRIGIYDHALHAIGGGQKYGCTIAEALQDSNDVTFITNKKIDIKTLEKWYDLNLKKCNLKVVPISINKNDPLINPTIAEISHENPFDPISFESADYDVLINVNMVPHVDPFSLKSIFICHFPDGRKKNHFFVSHYDKIVTNSLYTSSWTKKKWDIEADEMIYPPVTMKTSGKLVKENIILAVGRFEESGSKKQLEMAKIFHNMGLKNWKLILVGGSTSNNPYLERVKSFAKNHSSNIEVKTNVFNGDLKKLYKKAKLFWHACGLKQNIKTNPHLVEHFGMTTVEAMQNGCVPIVIDGGGQREIVDHKKDGFRFKNSSQLQNYTRKLIKNKKMYAKIQKVGLKSSKRFSKNKFQKKFTTLVDELIEKIHDIKNITPEAHHVYKKLTK